MGAPLRGASDPPPPTPPARGLGGVGGGIEPRVMCPRYPLDHKGDGKKVRKNSLKIQNFFPDLEIWQVFCTYTTVYEESATLHDKKEVQGREEQNLELNSMFAKSMLLLELQKPNDYPTTCCQRKGLSINF